MDTDTAKSISASTRVQVYQPHEGNFKPGNPGGPGRPKGSRNRVQADLAQLILQASENTGFITINEKGEPVPGERGTLGFLEWAALHMPKVYLGLLARTLPYHVLNEAPQRSAITREEALIQLQERGLPIDLLNVLRLAPQPLDPGEDPDPYKLAVEGGVTPITEMALTPKPDAT
jgi:hypothetical protein